MTGVFDKSASLTEHCTSSQASTDIHTFVRKETLEIPLTCHRYWQLLRNRQGANVCTSTQFSQRGKYPQMTNVCYIYESSEYGFRCVCIISSSYHIYFHSVNPYRITKSIWIWKQSNLLKKSESEVNIKVYNNFSYWV